MRVNKPFGALCGMAWAIIMLGCLMAEGQTTAAKTPFICVTDLYHPHQDPDDHFDLATLFALPELDVKAIVIDMGKAGEGRPGIPVVNQMLALTGREVPYAVGLPENLNGFEDKGEDQPVEGQAGIKLIIQALQASEGKVTVFTTGSLRDVAAAFNREPDLFKSKVGRLYINAGHSDGGEEYNVELDRVAYVRMLRSGLPLYWVPCFGKGGYYSLWKCQHAELLEHAPEPLQAFFVYALEREDAAKKDPVAALREPINPEVKARLWGQERSMWCTAAFLHAAGRETGPFLFKELCVTIQDDGKTKPGSEQTQTCLNTFYIEAPTAYRGFMAGTLGKLLAEFPLGTDWKAVSPGAAK